jgi:hypothetical protein
LSRQGRPGSPRLPARPAASVAAVVTTPLDYPQDYPQASKIPVEMFADLCAQIATIFSSNPLAESALDL